MINQKNTIKKENKIIYLDNAATTKPLQEVIDIVAETQKNNYGNASSLHKLGLNAEDILDNCRNMIAKSINANADEIIFTSGGTESNNLAIKGFLKNKKGKIITTTIEHPSVLNIFKKLENDFEVVYINVDREGFIDLEELKNAVDKKTLLVSIIHGNNEIGTIQDIKKISNIVKDKNPETIIHMDACQSFTKTNINVKELNIDLMTLNAHKIHGPKGVGALFVKSGIKIAQLSQGGMQEQNKRPGTENIAGIIGFAKAVEIAINEKQKNIEHMKELQKYMIDKILSIPDTKLNGPENLDKRLCNNINISFKFVEGEAILMMLNEKGIYVSTGSACSSKKLEPSHVILAIGEKHEQAHGSVRFSLSKFTTKQEIDYAFEKLEKTIKILRKISHLN